MAGMMGSIKDPILTQIITQLEAKLTPKMKTGYQQIVVAGMHVLYSDQTHKLLRDQLKSAQQSGNIQQGIADGVVKLIALLFKESHGQLAVDAIIPAATTLLCHTLEFAETLKMVEITRDFVAETTRLTTARLVKAMGFNQQSLAAGIDQMRAQQKAGA